MTRSFEFTKMEAGGNDFVVADNRSGELSAIDSDIVAAVCRRRNGVGADGVLLLSGHPVRRSGGDEYDFEMEYYNADGGSAGMCGNGGRCIAHFAHQLLGKSELRFLSGDGDHTAWVESDLVKVTVRVVEGPVKMTVSGREGWLVNVGVPHFVTEFQPGDAEEFHPRANALRHSSVFGDAGANVEFLGFTSNGALKVRTFERGVEGETPSCGTGAVAAALVAQEIRGRELPVTVESPGGVVTVRGGRHAEEVILEGQVRRVYSGTFNLDGLSLAGAPVWPTDRVGSE